MTMEPCRPEYVKAASAIIAEGFIGKFSKMGLSRATVTCLMEELWETGQNHKYFVEITNNEVVAGVHLKWNGPKSNVSEKELCERYGSSEVSKFIRGMEALYEDVTDGDCYIVELAVTSDQRGKGIATSVIGNIIDFARDEGFRRVTLFVSDRNETAHKLYEKMGFKTEYVKESFLEKLYFDEPKWRFMTFDLSRCI